jgi:hypothetical protein
MFGSTILDVAIGLVFVYLLLSLLVTAGSELIASWLNWRADNLRKGLQRLLNPTLAQELYDHPLIKKLSKSNRWPSYIPSGTFALALVDVIANLNPGGLQPAKDLGSLISNVPDPDVRRVLSLLAEEAGQDGQKLKENIENWFNNSMDRVAGWYKRKAQAVNVTLAIVFTVAVNADSILIVRSLSNDPALRAALVAQAQELAKGMPAQLEAGQPGTGTKATVDELEKRINRLSGLGVPVGWTDEPGDSIRQWPGWRPGDRPAAAWGAMWLHAVRYHLLGWLLTTLAVSLGAPFWFDMLNKIITIRSAGRVPEQKSNPAPEQPKA